LTRGCGAPDPHGGANTRSVDLAKARQHWAFQPPKDPPAPSVKQKDWVKNPIDAFVLAKLEAGGMKLDRPFTRLPNSATAIAFLTDPWGTYIELTENLGPPAAR